MNRLLLSALLLLAACTPVADEPEPPTPPPSQWDTMDWVALADDGDPEGDCASADPDCLADILALSLAVDDERLHVLLEFASELPEQGTLEVFLFPTLEDLAGYSFRLHEDELLFWEAECHATRHEGCHWYEGDPPASFAWEQVDELRFGAAVDYADLGFEGLTALRTGAGAAPDAINATVEFTDRHPDALWATPTELQGLGLVEITLP